jgi:transposase-like protein
MAEKRTRRSFKAQVVKRLLEGGKGLSEVATELGLSTGQLSTWCSEQLAGRIGRGADLAQSQRRRRCSGWRRRNWSCARPRRFSPRRFSRKADERDEARLRAG